MTAEPIVHIIDDDASLCQALASLFRSVGLAAMIHDSVRSFMQTPRPDLPGCLLLDVRMPGISGLDFQAQLQDLGISLPVIIMTGHGDIPMSVRAMKAGALDFLPKPCRDQDLLDAVSAAIDQDRTRRAEREMVTQLRSLYETLSPRERQVMALVTAGRLNKQVAGDLSLSEITVKIHRGAAMRKMKARTLADLVRMAETLKLDPQAALSRPAYTQV